MEKLITLLSKSEYGKSLIEQEKLKRGPQYKETQSKKYLENLVSSVSKSYYQQSYLRSLIKVEEQETVAVMSEEDKQREETIEKLRRKWLMTPEQNVPSSKYSSSLLISSFEPEHDENPNVEIPPDLSNSLFMMITIENVYFKWLRIAFVSIKATPKFLEKWDVDSIRVKFCFFDEADVLSPELLFRSKPQPGALSVFQTPYIYQYKNQKNDARLVPYLFGSTQIEVTDSSGDIVIGTCTLNFLDTIFLGTEEPKIYELDIFSTDNIRLGSLQFSTMVKKEKPEGDLPMNFEVQQNGDIFWNVEIGKADVIPVEIANPTDQELFVGVTLAEKAKHPNKYITASIVSYLEEIRYWIATKELKNEVFRDLEVEGGSFAAKLGPNERKTFLIKLQALSLLAPKNDPHNPSLLYNVIIDYKSLKKIHSHRLIPIFAKPIISRTITYHIPKEETFPLALKLQSVIEPTDVTDKYYFPRITLENPLLKWNWIEFPKVLEIFWNFPYEGYDQPIEAGIFFHQDRYKHEIVEVCKITLVPTQNINFKGSLGAQNAIQFYPTKFRSDLQKVHFATSHPEIINLHKFKTPRTLLESSTPWCFANYHRPTKQRVKIVCIDSVSQRPLEWWTLTVNLSQIDIEKFGINAQDDLDTLNDAGYLVDKLDCYFSGMNSQLYGAHLPNLTNIPDFDFEVYQMMGKVSEVAKRDFLPKDASVLIGVIFPKLANYLMTIQSLRQIYLLQDLLDGELMTYMLENVLKVQKHFFIRHLSVLAITYVLECSVREKNSQNQATFEMNFDICLKNLLELLRTFERANSKQTLVKEEEKRYTFTYTKSLDEEFIKTLSTDVNNIVNILIPALSDFKKEANSLAIQIESLFETIISIFNNVYIVTIEAESNKSMKPYLTHAIAKVEPIPVITVEEKNKELAHFAEKIKKMEDECKAKGSLGNSNDDIDMFIAELEQRLAELMNKDSTPEDALKLYKDLNKYLIQVLHIKYLTKFMEAIGDKALHSFGEFGVLKEEIRKTVLDLAFRQSFYEKLNETYAFVEKSQVPFLRWLDLMLQLMSILINISEKFQQQACCNSDFLAYLSELLDFLNNKIQNGKDIDAIRIQYGLEYDLLFRTIKEDYLKITQGTNFSTPRIEKLIRVIAEMTEFLELEKTTIEFANRLEKAFAEGKMEELIPLRVDAEAILDVRARIETLLPYFEEEFKELTFFKGFMEETEIKFKAEGPGFSRIQAALDKNE